MAENRIRIWTKVTQGNVSVEKEVEVDVQHWTHEKRMGLIKVVLNTAIQTGN